MNHVYHTGVSGIERKQKGKHDPKISTMDEKQKFTEDNGNHNKTKRNNMECEGDAIVSRTMFFHGGGKQETSEMYIREDTVEWGGREKQ